MTIGAWPMTVVWLGAMILFLVVEGATVGLVSIWFAGGALAALIAAMVGGPLWIQFVLFLVVSAVLLMLLRPLVRRGLQPKTTATNADRLVGKAALVTEEIDNLRETGAVKLEGVVWTARSRTEEIIPVGATIRVCRIEGVKLIVENQHDNV